MRCCVGFRLVNAVVEDVGLTDGTGNGRGGKGVDDAGTC